MNYAAMAKKEIRDVIRTNNKHLRDISRMAAPERFLNADTINHFRNQSLLALDELDRRQPTFEDAQLRQSSMAAYIKAMDALNRHSDAVKWLNETGKYRFDIHDRE